MNSETTVSPTHSIVGLLRELRDEASTLLNKQLALLKVELKENATEVGTQFAKIAAGGAVAAIGAIVLLIGLGQLLGVLLESAGLAPATAQWLGSVILGLVVVVIGWAMFTSAKKALAHDSLVPRKTVETLKADERWAQSKLQTSHETSR
jgi:hypothetical protein